MKLPIRTVRPHKAKHIETTAQLQITESTADKQIVRKKRMTMSFVFLSIH